MAELRRTIEKILFNRVPDKRGRRGLCCEEFVMDPGTYYHYRAQRARRQARRLAGPALEYMPRPRLKALSAAVLLALIMGQVAGVGAFEAHVVNVTARIVNDLPLIDPPGGEYCTDSEEAVELSTTLAGADIIYTTDGSEPLCYGHGTVYAGPFVIGADTTVRARTCHDGKQSALRNWTFEFDDAFCAYDSFLITKVYADVGCDRGEEYLNEIVEIYNPNPAALDLSGWVIADNEASDVIPDSPAVPAYGFALLSGDAGTWDYWEIPDQAVKITIPDGRIGNGLDNGSDRVYLYDPDGEEVDAMSYGDDTSAFDPAVPSPDECELLGRVPVDLDTDRAADWQVLQTPFVELYYPSGGEVWYVGRTYTIQWSAVNSNGGDSELSIDLYYSNDSGNTWGRVAKDTENDGEFDWRVPLFLEDDTYYVPSDRARIRVVARGPENFLVQDEDQSRDFCPPIDYDRLTPEEIAMLEMIENGTMDVSTSTGLHEPDGSGNESSDESNTGTSAQLSTGTSAQLSTGTSAQLSTGTSAQLSTGTSALLGTSSEAVTASSSDETASSSQEAAENTEDTSGTSGQTAGSSPDGNIANDYNDSSASSTDDINTKDTNNNEANDAKDTDSSAPLSTSTSAPLSTGIDDGFDGASGGGSGDAGADEEPVDEAKTEEEAAVLGEDDVDQEGSAGADADLSGDGTDADNNNMENSNN